MRDTHNIAIHIDGYFHGVRHWQNVPRVGECVAVNIDGSRLLVVVKQVVWGNLHDDLMSLRPNCQIDLWCDTPKEMR